MAHQPKFTDDWDKEQKKLKIVSLVFVVILVAMAVMIAISVLRGHL
jgi:flagellar basal body-associated protein FliL